ncbi:MAG: hypothetical protein MASP_00799 [Candidatus Methanolliviera sp. GoM_asphalt]|nr:MAG: hypothetical protein MASP_00799 [Candidatus Methanolliviera sp. GoM_asphalt]
MDILMNILNMVELLCSMLFGSADINACAM